MKPSILALSAAVAVASPLAAGAFAPPSTFSAARPSLAFGPAGSSPSARSLVADPFSLGDLPAQASAFSDGLSSLLLSDEMVADAGAAAGTAAAAAGDSNGWFGFLAGPIEYLLQIIHLGLVSIGAPGNAWGISIVGMTVIIKVLTYPLTKQQLTSTNRMQALQPTIKEIQAKYQSNPEVMNQKIAEVYQENEVNPLAGCIPSIVQIPVFIGLYRGILNLAKADKLEESFLWLPNLEGPTYGADPAHGSDWILKGWEGGVPTLGWHDTIAFASIPIILVVSQSLSMQIMTPKVEGGPEQPAFLKFLPLLIGWFSLNVPAALGIYWVANNFITTAISVQIRQSMPAPAPVAGGGGAAASSSVLDAKPSAFTPAPIREKPSGFSANTGSADDITPITPIDAEIVDDVAESVTGPPRNMSASGGGGGGTKKKRGKRKKKKRS